MTTQNKTKAPTWDLDSIFPGGSRSKEFAEFKETVVDDIDSAALAIEKLPKSLDKESRQQWAGWILEFQRIREHLRLAGTFTACLTSQNVEDKEALRIEAELHEVYAKFGMLVAGLESLSIKQSDEEWDELLKFEGIKEIRFTLNEIRTQARDKMPEALEKLAIELSAPGFHSWNSLYDKIAGDLRVDIKEDGEVKPISLGQNANRLSNPNREIRRDAFEKMESAWETRADYAAMALNSLLGYRITVYKNRKWDSILKEALQNCRMKEDTLNAMWQAISDKGSELKRYVDAKKKITGIDKFCWYDQTAPVGKYNKEFTFNEAGKFVENHIGNFSEEMGKHIRMALDRRWVEAEDRPGKRGGAWCGSIPLKKESRVFMTFSGTFNSLQTLAHELGHAYHGYVLKDLPAYARGYPMTLAETASIFNELVVADAAYEVSDNQDEKLMLLDMKLQRGLTFFSNIRTRFLFDTWVYKKRGNGFVAKDQMNELMIKAQKEAFWGILDEEKGMHPLFWCSKLHFYLSSIPFYNFPYTFGFLFASGVYDRAVKEGKSFANNYKALLSDTGKMTTEDAASKHLDIDLTKTDFWNDAVGRVLADIELFIELADKN